MVQLGHSDATPVQPTPERAGHAAQPAALADRDVAAAQGGGSVTQGGPGPDGGDQSGLLVATLQTHQLLEGGAADDPVDRQPGVALELVEGPHRGVPEDPVDPARIETQRAQALLQLGHVVTPQHRSPAVEEAVTEPKTCFDQGIPGLGTADAVHPEPAQALESLERGARARTEDAVGIDGRARENGGQAVLHVGDSVTTIPDGERQAYR